jgi:hypothetical protein
VLAVYSFLVKQGIGINPAARSMALQLGIKDHQLAQSVGELRIFRSEAGRGDGGVKAAE